MGASAPRKLWTSRFAVAQPGEVRDALRSLEAEAEASGNGRLPVFELCARGKRAEGVVDLDGVELRARSS